MSSKSILVVDDDSTIRIVLTQCLTKHDRKILQAASGEEAIEICGSQTIDLAILDYKMPGISGLETAEVIRDRYDVPFIFITAYADAALLRAAVEEGAHGYLVKPIRIGDVIPTVEAALRRSADAHHLTRAITETKLINVAIGILMGRHSLTKKQALEHLHQICRPRRIKALEAAKEIVDALEADVLSRRRGIESPEGAPPATEH